MTTYVDSSALVAVYVTERFSGTARAVIGRIRQVPFTPLHRLEMRNAFEMLVGRGAITRRDCRAIRRQLDEDIVAQRLVEASPDLDAVFAGAVELSTRHTARTLARSLDLLHVAAAHALACTRFVSGDDRQLAVARASGLTVVDIKRTPRRRQPS